MALGVLTIIYIMLIVVALIVQIALYKNKYQSKNGVFIINTLLGIILSYIAYSSLPTNFTGQRILAAGWGIISIIAIILKLSTKKSVMISKTMLSVAIVGGLSQLFL